MRLSDVRRCEPKLIYLNHSTLLVPNEALTRCSNRLLDPIALAHVVSVPLTELHLKRQPGQSLPGKPILPTKAFIDVLIAVFAAIYLFIAWGKWFAITRNYCAPVSQHQAAELSVG